MAKLNPMKRIVAKMISDHLSDALKGAEEMAENFHLVSVAGAMQLNARDVELLKEEIRAESKRQAERASLPRKWTAVRESLME